MTGLSPGIPDPYSVTVRGYFENPVHAGDLPSRYTDTYASEASDGASGARIGLALALQGGNIAAMRFRAWGCPHLVAAAEAVCERFEGKEVESLARFEPQELMDILSVPVEKTGRILVLEDALQRLHSAVTGKTTTDGT